MPQGKLDRPDFATLEMDDLAACHVSMAGFAEYSSGRGNPGTCRQGLEPEVPLGVGPGGHRLHRRLFRGSGFHVQEEDHGVGDRETVRIHDTSGQRAVAVRLGVERAFGVVGTGLHVGADVIVPPEYYRVPPVWDRGLRHLSVAGSSFSPHFDQ